MPKTTTEDFISKAKEIHGDKYDYSLVDYQGSAVPVTIICPIHGPFEQKPTKHVSLKRGCPKCGGTAKKTTKEFIAEARTVHGDKYDYSKVEYNGNKKHITIICSEHGEFRQLPSDHLNKGSGCPECGKLSKARSRRNELDQVLDDFRRVHGNKYDYSKVEYRDTHTPVEILCQEHGSFWQSHANHCKGQGCPFCAGNAKKDTEAFIEEARAVHGDRYDYSQAVYTGAHKKLIIICPEHGPWNATPHNHVSFKSGCPKCGDMKAGQARMLTKEDFVERAKAVHGDFYDYSKTVVDGFHNKSIITCPDHGDFEQQLQNHLSGNGCPKCACNGKSKQEGVIEDLIKTWLPDLEVQRNIRGIIPEFTVKMQGGGSRTISNGELDIYIPEKNLAIEYNGMFWHSRDRVGCDYHVSKRKACDKAGIRMFTIWEADWFDERKRPILERYLKHALGIKDERTVYARKCVIRDVPQAEYREFMDKNHVQGYASAKEVKKGLYTKDGELVACMSFKQLKNRDVKEHPHTIWNMVRYATSCNVPGGRSRLFKHIQKEYRMDHVESHLDRDYFTGQSYLKEDGWELVEDTQSTLDMWHPRFGRQSRQNWWHKNIPATLKKLGLPEDLYDPNLTQEVNAERAGVKFYNNSGNARFEWHSEEGLADPVYQEWLKSKNK